MKNKIAQVLFIAASTVIGFTLSGSIAYLIFDVKETYPEYIKIYLKTMSIALLVLGCMGAIFWVFIHYVKKLYNYLFK